MEKVSGRILGIKGQISLPLILKLPRTSRKTRYIAKYPARYWMYGQISGQYWMFGQIYGQILDIKCLPLVLKLPRTSRNTRYIAKYPARYWTYG